MRGEIAVKATPGVIDSLAEGFGLVNRFLWVALIPVVLDVTLWLAPKVSALPVVEQLLAAYRQAVAEFGDPSAAVGGADVQMIETLGRSLGEMNVLGLLAWNPAGATIPSFVAGQSVGASSALTVASLGDFIALGLGLQLVGLFLGCVYLGLLGQLVRDGRPSLRGLAERVGRYWLTFVAYVGLIVGLIVLMAVVISVAVAVLALVSPSLAAFLSAALTTATFFLGLFLVLYMFFFTAGVVVGDRGPLSAISSSFRTVQGSFWSSLGLVLLTLLIGQGMLVIWSRLAGEVWGVMLAVVGNAYVASGLTAATMYFYRSRTPRATAGAPLILGRGDDARR